MCRRRCGLTSAFRAFPPFITKAIFRLTSLIDIYCFRHIGDSIQQVFERYSWTKAVLAYRPTDHMEWSGDLSCQQFMASGMF